jgi:hypothetical protein
VNYDRLVISFGLLYRSRVRILPLVALLCFACQAAPSSPIDDPVTRMPGGNPGDTRLPGDGTASGPPAIQPAAACMQKLLPAAALPFAPSYDQWKPALSPTCSGTAHQTIEGVEKLVFLGDSITVGTPPTLPTDFYSARVAEAVLARFGAIEIATCAQWGAETNDLQANDDQLGRCFPGGVEDKRTLVVMTMGGNDIAGWARAHASPAEAMANADATLSNLGSALAWLKDPAHFPNGSYVVFANVYEFTDATGDLASCPTATLAGLSGNLLDDKDAILHMEEGYLRLAVETHSDMIFTFEPFCGHGYHNGDPASPCYRGPGTERWFDITCIHPTPTGHGVLANAFMDIIGR